MKDLASRLRAIVRENAARELTYEPDLQKGHRESFSENDSRCRSIAEALGGEICDEAGHCIVIDRVFDSTVSHGRWTIDQSVITGDAPLGLLDSRADSAAADWASRLVFFDTETTGLSGGAGTMAFLAGCGWFEPAGFRVRQWLLISPAGEKTLLGALGKAFGEASMLVSYNGRSFDVPLMEMRWAFHRETSPFGDLPHFDMLSPARRLWSRRDAGEPGEDASCSLSTLERDVLGFHRLDDVPGFEIPSKYFQFLRTGDAQAIHGVLDHHRHDIVSLAVLMSHALRLAREGPDLCRTDHEVVALGRVYERAALSDPSMIERAIAAFDRASVSADRYVRAHAFSRLGLIYRREARHDEAAAAWRGVIDAAGGRRSLFPLERLAAEALAIHHEHRAPDLDEAKRYAESLREQTTGRAAAGIAHRLARIERKMSEGKKKGGPKAAPLLD
jgi:uncharacterized protein YprB with RNaseH-like and TPR domain